MIYFLPVIQFLFLLITVSSKQCHDWNVIQVLGGKKEFSENGYRYGIIQTPNFPHPFRTPFRQTWLIDASHRKNGTQINVYFTQMYLSRGVRIFQHPTYEFCDHYPRPNSSPILQHGPRQECGNSADGHEVEFAFNSVQDLTRISTTCPYLEIEVDVPKLNGYHYRTRDPFLFHVYGFNITYEILPESEGNKTYSCHTRNCSSLGHCYLADNWRDFYCDCVKDQRGKYCEVSSQFCDPENNITFCSNGGKCSLVGSGDGLCNCEGTGFTGPTCELKESKSDQPKVSARTGCSSAEECPLEDLQQNCELDPTASAPCSCRPTPRIEVQVDWVKYEAAISVSENYTILQNQSKIEMDMQRSVRFWLESNGLKVIQNVFVRFHPPREDFPVKVEELLIHFHGPLNVLDQVRSALNRWLSQRTTLPFWKLIPLAENSTFAIYTMPRVKYKSIEVSKPNTTLEIGYSVSFTCTAITGRSKYFAKSDIRFRWFKDGMPVNKSLSTSRHITIGRQPLNDNETVSILMIDQVSPFDGGTYTCEITDLEFGDQDCGQHPVDVILPPQIEVNPMSLTLEKRKLDRGVVITCTDGRNAKAYDLRNTSIDMVWFRSGGMVLDDDVVVLEDIVPQGKLLRILKAEHTESFVCTGYNKRGGSRSKEVKVNVLDSRNAPSCKRHWERLPKVDKESSLLWEWTAPNSVAKIPCPRNYLGFVQRTCVESRDGTKAYWGRSDFSRCISQYLHKVNKTLQNAKRGFGDYKLADPVALMTQVEEYMDSNQILYAGEGQRIIVLVGDIVQYAFDRAKVEHGKLTDVDVSGLFPVFFRTVVKIMKRPNSCTQERSINTLCQNIVDMAVRGAMQATTADSKSKLLAHIEISDVLMLQTLPISTEAKYRDLPYIFPEKERMTDPNLSWLKDTVRVIFPLDSAGFRRDAQSPLMYYLVMAAYKNLSSLLVPNDIPGGTSMRYGMGTPKSNIRTSVELVSPIVQISIPEGYYMPQESHIKILFNLSKEHKSFHSSRSTLLPVVPSKVKSTFFSCGALDNSTVSSTKKDYQRMRWTMDACQMEIRRDGLVECQCEDLGIFGLLNVSHLEDEILEENNDIHKIVIFGFSICILSCVLSATVLCIYLKCKKCRISMNSLYALKLFDCIFIFCAVFIVLLGRSEMPSASWLVWSTTACSFLISSVNVQVTKALRVLLMEAKPDLPGFIFPWLRHVSQITLLSAITFSTVLPLWTATVARIIGANNSNESAFDETSHVFAVFVGIVGLDVLVFLGIYYRAVLKTNRELDGCQQHSQSVVVPSNFTMEMIWILKYRIKTLHRSLCLTLSVLIMTLAIILHENLRHSLYIQWFLGFSAIMMGLVIFFSYVTHCEYPLCEKLWSQNPGEKPLLRDPEIENVREKDGSRRKLYAISSEMRGNGSVVGGLLPPPQPILRNSMRHFGEESETMSVSTVEEQSMDTFSTEISYRQSSTSTQTHTQKFPPINMNNRRKSLRSVGSNTMSSSGGSSNRSKYASSCSSGKQVPALRKVPCLILRDKDAGEYIMPSVHCTNGSGTTFNTTSTTNGTAMQIPQQESSSGSAGSYNNYLPIHEHDDLQKISQGLKLLLSDQ